jgi:hypothetical protein
MGQAAGGERGRGTPAVGSCYLFRNDGILAPPRYHLSSVERLGSQLQQCRMLAHVKCASGQICLHLQRGFNPRRFDFKTTKRAAPSGKITMRLTLAPRRFCLLVHCLIKSALGNSSPINRKRAAWRAQCEGQPGNCCHVRAQLVVR